MQVVYRALVFCGVVAYVAPVAREIEKPGGKSGFIQSLGDELFSHDGESHDAVFGLKHRAVYACRGIGCNLLSSGDNYIFAWQVAASPFDGACLDVCAVFGFERKTGAGVQGGGEVQEDNGQADDKIFHGYGV